MLGGDADRAVQLMCDRRHRPDRPADRDLRDGDRVFGLRRVESVIRRCGDGQCRCGPGSFDLAGHGGQGMLDRLELGQRTAELDALARVLDRHGGGRVERTDDLGAATPCAAHGQLGPDRRIDG